MSTFDFVLLLFTYYFIPYNYSYVSGNWKLEYIFQFLSYQYQMRKYIYLKTCIGIIPWRGTNILGANFGPSFLKIMRDILVLEAWCESMWDDLSLQHRLTASYYLSPFTVKFISLFAALLDCFLLSITFYCQDYKKYPEKQKLEINIILNRNNPEL